MREAIDTIRLDKEGIARASEAARELLDERHKDKRQATAAWLVFENNLLKLQEHFCEDAEAQVITTNVLGRYRLLVRVRGEWEYSAYEASGMAPGYSYLGGYNIIALTEARKPLGSLASSLPWCWASWSRLRGLHSCRKKRVSRCWTRWCSPPLSCW